MKPSEHTAKRPHGTTDPGRFFLGAASPVQALVVTAVVLAVYLVVVYPQGFQGPFMADDFVFLEKARHLSFFSIWLPEHLQFHYYRPWSRELQYWLWPRLFGIWEPPFHALAFALCLTSLTLYFELCRRLAGAGAAVIATVGLAALASWSVLLLWIAGIQDLWMLALALACLLTFVTGRLGWSAALFLLALLSKETAAVVPAIALTHALVVEKRSPGIAFRRTAPMWILLVAWAALHPQLGGRIGHPSIADVPPASASTALLALPKPLLALANLDELPRPTIGWPLTIKAALAGILPLAALLVWMFWAIRSRPDGDRSLARVAMFGGAWFVIATLPLLVAGPAWQSYYALLGMMGAWLVIGVLLARRRWLALPLIAALVIARVGRATTPSADWGSEWYQARAAIFMLDSRAYFQARQPAFPPHSRIYLSKVPGGVGILPGGKSIVMQAWSGDTTVETFYVSAYQPRAAGDVAGRDYFFSFEPARGWYEEPFPVVPGSSRVRDRENFALRMSQLNRAGDSLAEYLRLAAQFPAQPGYTFNVASCYYRLGDSLEAARWYQRAAAIPGAPESMKRIAEQTRHLLPK